MRRSRGAFLELTEVVEGETLHLLERLIPEYQPR
jgi:hypothetical protein